MDLQDQEMDRQQKRKQQRKNWVDPMLCQRARNGKFVLEHKKLLECPDKFLEYYKMSIQSFNYLLSTVRSNLKKKNTVMRDAIRPEERLAVTLRYLSGCTTRSLHTEYLIGSCTIGNIVRETCTAIWNNLQNDYLSEPSKEDLFEISKRFESGAKFPHCMGAIGGKVIETQVKKVLIAVVDFDYCFRYIHVGTYIPFPEGESANILKDTAFGRDIYSENLDIPDPKPLPNTEGSSATPYVFVANEAFALCKNLMRPYPLKNITSEKKIFNYRLSRARSSVDCAFGILVNKWRVLLNPPMFLKREFVEQMIKTCCVLHNFVRRRDGYSFEETLSCPLEDIPAQGVRGNQFGLETRDCFSSYFCSSEGSLPSQDKALHFMYKD